MNFIFCLSKIRINDYFPAIIQKQTGIYISVFTEVPRLTSLYISKPRNVMTVWLCGIRLCPYVLMVLRHFHLFVPFCILFFLISSCLSIFLYLFLFGAACQAAVLTVQTALGWMEMGWWREMMNAQVQWERWNEGAAGWGDVEERWRDGKWEIDMMHERLMRLWGCAGTTDSDGMSAGLLKGGGTHKYTDLCAGK